MKREYATLLLGCLGALAPSAEAAGQTGRVEGVVEVARGVAAGTVVYLVPAEARAYAPPDRPATIDQVRLRFIPQVVAVVAGTVVDFPNSDPILHNVFSPRGPGDGFNLGTYPPGETRSRRFVEPGVHVILCHMHPDMVAYVAVVPTPYHAVVEADGAFILDGVPAGHYTLRTWRSRRHAQDREVAVTAGQVTRVRLGIDR
jgi:plastocyanin